MFDLPSLLVPQQKYFGLSIGRNSLRAVEVKNGQVQTYAEVMLPEGIYQEGVVVDQTKFVIALKQLLSQGKFSTMYVVVCFSEFLAFNREHVLPVIADDEIHEAVSRRVKDLFPFPEADLYFDWKILDRNQAGIRVIVVAVQKKVLDSLITALQAAGLKPLSFEPGGGALAKLLALKNGQQALVVEVNRRGAYVTLLDGEKALFTTVVNYTTQDTPQTYFQNVVQNVNEISDYYKNKGVLKPEAVQLILTGEVATRDWAQELTKRIQYPVKILTSPLNNPAFNKAFAAASTTVAPPHDPQAINLLPPATQQLYDQERTQTFYRALIAQILVVMSVLAVSSLAVFLTVQLQKQNLENQVKVLTGKLQNQQAETQKLLLFNAQAKNVVTLSPLRKTPRNKIAAILSILPATIHVSQLDYDDNKLMFTISGLAERREELLAFKSKLEDTQEFRQITLPLGSLETPINIKFTMTLVSNL